ILLLNSPKLVTLESLRATVLRIPHLLAVNSDYARAFRSCWAKFPQYENSASEETLVRWHHGEQITADSLIDLIENNPNVLNSLTLNQKAVEERREEKDKQRMISELDEGKGS